MNLVSSLVDLVQQVSSVMTQSTFQSFFIVLTGWVFARRRTVTGMILAACLTGPDPRRAREEAGLPPATNNTSLHVDVTGSLAPTCLRADSHRDGAVDLADVARLLHFLAAP